jgi:hypothetical protein
MEWREAKPASKREVKIPPVVHVTLSGVSPDRKKGTGSGEIRETLHKHQLRLVEKCQSL